LLGTREITLSEYREMSMAKIEIYTKQTCPYCTAAKALLANKQVSYQEYAIDENDTLRQEMIKRSGGTTVPQVFIDGKSIGGCDDLHALDEKGELDKLLK